MKPEDTQQAAPEVAPQPAPAALDLDSDEPLVCNRDQPGDTTCEACQ